MDVGILPGTVVYWFINCQYDFFAIVGQPGDAGKGSRLSDDLHRGGIADLDVDHQIGFWKGLACEDIACLQRSEEHPSELQSLMRISYAVFFLYKKKMNTSWT